MRIRYDKVTVFTDLQVDGNNLTFSSGTGVIKNGTYELELPYQTTGTLAVTDDIPFFYQGAVTHSSAMSAGSVADIIINLGTISSKYPNGLPNIMVNTNNYNYSATGVANPNAVYINNFLCMGVSYQDWTSISNMGGLYPYKYANFSFRVRVKNTYPSTTIPANTMTVSYIAYV